MITDLNTYRNKIKDLTSLENTRFENIFKMGKYNEYYFYNIIKKVDIGDDINPEFYYEMRNNSSKPWTTLSFQIYGTQDLWWLICLANNIRNPIQNPKLGATLKIIKPSYVSAVLGAINSQL